MSKSYLISLVLFVSCVLPLPLLATTVVVNDVDGLMTEIRQLSDGDTLLIRAGNYSITEDVAPDGLIVATEDWDPYTDVVILGEGAENTILDFKESYGFTVFASVNALIKDLAIINGHVNGGIHVHSGELNLDNVSVTGCKSVSTVVKPEAYGGAVCYDENSMLDYVRNCTFADNYADNGGGALAFLNVTPVSSSKYLDVEGNSIFNNEAGEMASAIYFRYARHYFKLTNNAIYANRGVVAIYVDGYRNIHFRNNSIVLNESGGVYLATAMRNRSFFNNNAIVDNASYDIEGEGTSYIKGNFNVSRDFTNASFSGYFNERLLSSAPLFELDSDTLTTTPLAVRYLAGRVPESAMTDFDINGDECISPADIGAANIPLGDSVAVWTGSEDQDFLNVGNWKDSIFPQEGVSNVIISDCGSNDYPILGEDGLVVIDLESTRLAITPTGILKNSGSLTLDSLLVESQNGGTGQLYNDGVIVANDKRVEYYYGTARWTPMFVSDPMLEIADLIPGASASAQVLDEGSATHVGVSSTELFGVEHAYLVKGVATYTAEFEIFDESSKTFNLQHTANEDSLASGWNLIGNPYSLVLQTSKVMANEGNAEAAAGALYKYDGLRYRVWVDGIGDVEASKIYPNEGFYVKALDPDSDSDVDNVDFKVELSNASIIANTVAKSTEVEREGVLSITLENESGSLYDRTFLRFSNEASGGYDYTYDALKLPRIGTRTSSLIYTRNSGDGMTNYAVNSQRLDENEVLSIPLFLDFYQANLADAILQFDVGISNSDSVSYLLHDTELDSSLSKELIDGDEIAFKLALDSAALYNRFSLQVFDGEIPAKVLNVAKRYADGNEEIITETSDVIVEKDTTAYLLASDTLWTNPDTTFVVLDYVDSVLVATIEMAVTHRDSVFYDTIFTDTTKLWGTYVFDVVDTSVSIEEERMTEEIPVDTSYSTVWYMYTLIDTLVETSLREPIGVNDNINIYTVGDVVFVESKIETPLVATVYSMSGLVLRQESMPYGVGKIENIGSGVCIVSVEQMSSVFSQKVLLDD